MFVDTETGEVREQLIRAKRGRKPKTDRQDAQHILKLMLKDDFLKIWVPSWENRDLRQLLWHRHRMVQARTRIMSQLQAVALKEGLRCKKKLWRGKRMKTTGSHSLGYLGEPAAGGSAEVAGRAEPDDCRADGSHRPGSAHESI
ncbi:MAG: transposase [Candidatus Sulfotelmatobacter sp.]